jgi:hypothetical protein
VSLAEGIEIANQVRVMAKDKAFHPVTYSDLYNDSNGELSNYRVTLVSMAACSQEVHNQG